LLAFHVSYAWLSCNAVKFCNPFFTATTEARTYSGSAGRSREKMTVLSFRNLFRLASSTSWLAALQV